MVKRPLTLKSEQFADIPNDALFWILNDIGFDGVELSYGTSSFNIRRLLGYDDAGTSDAPDASMEDRSQEYVQSRLTQLKRHNLSCGAISCNDVSQCVLNVIDERHLAVIPDYLHGDDYDQVWRHCSEEMKLIAKAAKKFGVRLVNGFTGSSIWPCLYSFPPVPQDWIDDGFKLLKERWTPILDVFAEEGVKFALEVHPLQIAFDIKTARRTLDALDNHPAFGFNVDTSHLLGEGVDPSEFIRTFHDRIFHVHLKDGVFGSQKEFKSFCSGWGFSFTPCPVGQGDVKFAEVVRALDAVDYQGPISVDCVDLSTTSDAPSTDRLRVAQESYQYVKDLLGGE